MRQLPQVHSSDIASCFTEGYSPQEGKNSQKAGTRVCSVLKIQCHDFCEDNSDLNFQRLFCLLYKCFQQTKTHFFSFFSHLDTF